jgi:putative ABC transport system substrate-binding protein
LNDTHSAAKVLGVMLVERDAADPGELKALFGSIKRGTAEAVLFASNVIRHRYQHIVLPMATAAGMAMVGSRKDVVDKGALFSYSYDFGKIGHAVASRYVIPVLQGAKKPADLPIEEVTEYELSVNAGVAKRYGWTVPPSILYRAVKVVE